MGTLPAWDNHRSGSVTLLAIVRIRYGRTGPRGDVGIAPGRRVRTCRVCEAHPALARVARADCGGDLRTLRAEPGLSDGGDPFAVGAIPRLHLADRRGLH